MSNELNTFLFCGLRWVNIIFLYKNVILLFCSITVVHKKKSVFYKSWGMHIGKNSLNASQNNQNSKFSFKIGIETYVNDCIKNKVLPLTITFTITRFPVAFTGSLRFISKNTNGTETVMWTRTGTQGNKWCFADLSFATNDSPVQVLYLIFCIY